MPLAASNIKENNLLSGLTEEQVSAIVTLANNIGQQDTNKAIGEVHRRYDADIKELTGKEKPDGSKTYDHIRSVITELKENGSNEELTKLKGDLQTARTKITTLQNKIDSGDGDAVIKSQLAQAKRDLQQKQDDIDRMKRDHETATKNLNDQIVSKDDEIATIQWHGEVSRARSEIKLRDDLSEGIRKSVERDAINTLGSYTRKLEKDTNGKVRYIYYNGDQRVNNPQTQAPATTEEILLTSLGDAVATQRSQGGTGSGGVRKPGENSGGGGASTFSLNGISTQREASTAIYAHLSAQGLAAGSDEHTEAFNKIWDEQVAEAGLQIQ